MPLRCALIALLLKGALSLGLHLSCDVTVKPGLIQYQLSPRPGPDCQDQGWQDHNKTALTREQVTDPDLVHSLTNHSVILKKCLKYLYFSAQCPSFVDAHCQSNCSSVLVNPSDLQNPPNNVCFGERCFEMNRFVMTLVPVALGCVAVIGGALWGFYKYKRHRGQMNLQRQAQDLEQPQKNQDVHQLELRPLQNDLTGHRAPDHAPDHALLSNVHVE